MAVPELLRPQYLVDSVSYRMRTRARTGYHMYKEIWCAAVGEELSCMREVENYRDAFAVAASITRFTSALAEAW